MPYGRDNGGRQGVLPGVLWSTVVSWLHLYSHTAVDALQTITPRKDHEATLLL